jgi:hypothetical protein
MYQLPKKYNESLLKQKEIRVIFLHRKNILKTAVSAAIAEQNNIWAIGDKKKITKKMNEYNSLDISDLQRTIDFLYNSIKHYKEVIKKSNIRFFDIIYEDLYEGTVDSKLNTIKDLFSFLDYAQPSDEIINKIKAILSPKRKINNIEIHKKIPNIREIERKLGKKKNGFLFK